MKGVKHSLPQGKLEMVGTLEIVKVPRKDPIPDHPINFPPLENLHLELLENKKKLKQGLPLIPVVPPKIKPKPLPPPKDPPKKEEPQQEEDDSKLVEELQEDASTPEFKPKDPVEETLGEKEEETIETEDQPEQQEVTEEDELETFSQTLPPEEKEIFDEMTPVEQRRYIHMDIEHRERYQKEAYIWKWRLLKRSYPTRKDLPEFNEHSDLHTMKIAFDRSKRDLVLEDTVESYRMYLVVAWLGIEYICTRQIGIDMTGFTSAQSRMMHKYEKLLIELGERSYSKWGSNLPVEVRLGCLILFQAAVFYLSKIMMSQGNPLFADIFNGITGQPPAQPNTESTPKKKMRGPKIRAEDIRNMRDPKE